MRHWGVMVRTGHISYHWCLGLLSLLLGMVVVGREDVSVIVTPVFGFFQTWIRSGAVVASGLSANQSKLGLNMYSGARITFQCACGGHLLSWLSDVQNV